MSERKALWGVYLLCCADGSLYCGITNDMDNRLAAHNGGRGAKYTRGRLPVRALAFSGCCFDYGEALREERRIKRLPRQKKRAAVEALCPGGVQAAASGAREGH